jgi:hypothetical protein
MLEGITPPKKMWPCSYRSVFESLSDIDGKLLEQAVMNPEWPYATLEEVLRERGVKLAANGIKRHRTKACSCWKI